MPSRSTVSTGLPSVQDAGLHRLSSLDFRSRVNFFVAIFLQIGMAGKASFILVLIQPLNRTMPENHRTDAHSIVDLSESDAWIAPSHNWTEQVPPLLLKSILAAQVPFLVTCPQDTSAGGWKVIGGNKAACCLLQAVDAYSLWLKPNHVDPGMAVLPAMSKTCSGNWVKEDHSFLPNFSYIIWCFESVSPDQLSAKMPSTPSLCDASAVKNGLIFRNQTQLDGLARQLLSHSPYSVFVCSTDLQIVHVNRAAEVLLGRTSTPFQEQSMLPFIYPDDLFKVEQAFTHVSSAQDPITFQMRIVTSQQQLRYLSCHAVAVPAEKVIFLYASDVTDRKIANRLDRDLRVRFEAVYNKAQDAIMLTTPYGRIMQVNPAAAKILGYSVEALEQLSLDELLIRRDKGVPSILHEVRRDNVGHRGMVELRRKDQQVVICSFTLSENILPGIHLYILTDVTELEHSRRQIQQQKLRVEATLDSIGDAFFTVDNNWIITYWNRLAEERFKQAKKDVCGKKMWDVFHTQPDSEYTPYYLEAMREKRSVYFEIFSAADSLWYEVSIYPNDLGISVYIKDVSARKQAESKLRELNEQLDRKAIALANSNAELERFAYVASHDLQEPLRMVSSFLQLLQRKYSDQIDELSSKYIDFAVDGAERMKQLINDLLEYSRISLQGYALESVDVEEVVAEVQSLMAARITDTKAVLEIGEMPIIHANRIAVQQLLLNLVSNALKYHEKGSIPVVRINCEENLLEWKFTVTDNGIGIDKAFQEKIFIIFQRLHNREEYAGTGIGLAICKKIVDHLQGRIGVDSRPGQGSTFYFTIPRREITE